MGIASSFQIRRGRGCRREQQSYHWARKTLRTAPQTLLVRRRGKGRGAKPKEAAVGATTKQEEEPGGAVGNREI